jgi:hypothetical protein
LTAVIHRQNLIKRSPVNADRLSVPESVLFFDHARAAVKIARRYGRTRRVGDLLYAAAQRIVQICSNHR